MDLESEPIPSQPSNLELLSNLSLPLAPLILPGSTSNGSILTSSLSPTSNLVAPLAPSQLLASSQLPVSVTHFSQNGLAGIQKETLFSDSFSVPATNPFTNPFMTTATTAEDMNNGQKFATIGRSNPFTSPNKSKNPFLDRLETSAGTELTAGSPMSTSPGTSPEASLDPVSDNGSSTSTLNKIVSRPCSTHTVECTANCTFVYILYISSFLKQFFAPIMFCSFVYIYVYFVQFCFKFLFIF